jgi:hypothetical protein
VAPHDHQDERFSYVVLRRGPRPGAQAGPAAAAEALSISRDFELLQAQKQLARGLQEAEGGEQGGALPESVVRRQMLLNRGQQGQGGGPKQELGRHFELMNSRLGPYGFGMIDRLLQQEQGQAPGQGQGQPAAPQGRHGSAVLQLARAAPGAAGVTAAGEGGWVEGEGQGAAGGAQRRRRLFGQEHLEAEGGAEDGAEAPSWQQGAPEMSLLAEAGGLRQLQQGCCGLPCPARPVPLPLCPALPCPALPCPALPCPALPCPAPPRLLCLSALGYLPHLFIFPSRRFRATFLPPCLPVFLF